MYTVPRRVALPLISVLIAATIFFTITYKSTYRLKPESTPEIEVKNTNEEIKRSKKGSRLIIENSTESSQKLTEQHGTTLYKKYGVPITGLNHTIIYNKMPKCGSRTMDTLLRWTCSKLDIKPRRCKIVYDFERIDLKGKEESAIKRVQQLAAHPPALFSDHIFYFPVEKSIHPVYINMIRDPIEYLVSSYYYRQHGDKTPGSVDRVKKKFGLEMKMNETFDQCVLKEHKACVKEEYLSRIFHFFCGTHPKCSTDLKWSLNEAKRRVEEEYLIVGLLEDYESTLKLMEKLAPSLFNGIVTDYKADIRKKESGTFKLSDDN
ncbi:uronyl 2-sulfotransferase-like [Amphiura filiformis]|uniref:uronyl 2-sulfotransferase-like n=1 Tax=Amphiura filiformis TaxID=82378 RepID=UPI003B20E0B5